jgi:hypothetical protein
MPRQVEGVFITGTILPVTVFWKNIYNNKMCSELLCPQLLHIVAAGICNFKFQTSLQNLMHYIVWCAWLLGTCLVISVECQQVLLGLHSVTWVYQSFSLYRCNHLNKIPYCVISGFRCKVAVHFSKYHLYVDTLIVGSPTFFVWNLLCLTYLSTFSFHSCALHFINSIILKLSIFHMFTQILNFILYSSMMHWEEVMLGSECSSRSLIAASIVHFEKILIHSCSKVSLP